MKSDTLRLLWTEMTNLVWDTFNISISMSLYPRPGDPSQPRRCREATPHSRGQSPV